MRAMARQDKDGFIDPALVAAWRRMLWLVRGSAEVAEAMVPIAAGMTKDEISRLLARAGAPSGKGVEPVEQVLGLLGVVPRSRYEALRAEHEAMFDEYRELGRRVAEAEDNIDRLRGLLRDQGKVDEAEELLDSWGGLVRRTLRAQAGFVRSIANNGGAAPAPASLPPPEPEPAPDPEPPAPPKRAPARKRPTTTKAAATPKAAAKKTTATKKTTAAKKTTTPRRPKSSDA